MLKRWLRGRGAGAASQNVSAVAQTAVLARAMAPGESVDALYQQAAGAWQAGAWSDAAALAERAALLEPDLPSLHYLLGCCRMEQGLDTAVPAFERCLALGPAHPLLTEARVQLALCRARAALAQGAVPPTLALSPECRKSVSVIICSIDPARFSRASAMYDALLREVEHEIIGIRDARSLAEGYNRGLARARHPITVLSHDDIEIVSPDFAARLLRSLARYDVVGVAGTRRMIGEAWHFAGHPHLQGQIGMPGTDGNTVVNVYGMDQPDSPHLQALDGLFLAMHRDAARDLGFDQATFDGWHCYDLDFTFRAWLAGLNCATCNELQIVHASLGGYDENWLRYAGRFLKKHEGRIEPAQPGTRKPQLTALPVRSVAEWRLMTAYLVGPTSGLVGPTPGSQA